MRQPSDADMSWETFERMLRSQHGLRLLLAGMPPGSTLEDARFLNRKLKQSSRTPCSFLDQELGIRR